MTNLENTIPGLEEILAMVNELPEAGGGTAVETCTVTVTGNPHTSYYTTYIDGVFGWGKAEGDTPLTNVVCNSAIVISSLSQSGNLRCTTNGSVEMVYAGWGKYPDTHSDTVVIAKDSSGGSVNLYTISTGGQ